jgi:hypothetical protein
MRHAFIISINAFEMSTPNVGYPFVEACRVLGVIGAFPGAAELRKVADAWKSNHGTNPFTAAARSDASDLLQKAAALEAAYIAVRSQ